MRLSRLWRSAAVMIGAAVALSGCQPDARLAQSDVAIVLNDDERGTRLTAVDLASMEIVTTRKLRSQCLSIDGDPCSRVIVTAQTGGVGPDADDVAGVWQVAENSLSYVKLPYPNPSAVAVARGTGYVMHGFQVGDSLLMSAIDLAQGNRVTTGTVSEWANDPESVGDNAYVLVSASPREAIQGYSVSDGSIRRFERSLEDTVVAEIERRAMRVVADPLDEDNLILVGTINSPEADQQGLWHITRIQKSSGRVLEDLPLDLDFGAMALCAVNGDLAIADADGVDFDNPGNTVLILDGHTLKEKRRLTVSGSPAAVAAWGSRLLVYDGMKNELLSYEPEASTPLRRLRLAGRGLGTGDIVVFDAEQADGE